MAESAFDDENSFVFDGPDADRELHPVAADNRQVADDAPVTHTPVPKIEEQNSENKNDGEERITTG